ncbi:MAG: ATP-binding cassette domain-containing protein [bacterium]|nr:ATP-binding cassette domain-containing protein [bacterium]
MILDSVYDALPLVPLVLALVWTLRYQRFADFSLAASFALGGALFAVLVSAGLPVVLASVVGLAAGCLLGSLVGRTINTGGLDPLMAGLVWVFIGLAVTLAITEGTIRLPQGADLASLAEGLQEFGLPSDGAQAVLLSMVAVTLVGLTRVVLRSEWGAAYRCLSDTRGGRSFLEVSGQSPRRFSNRGFVIAGGLAAMSGILVCTRDGQITSSAGLDYLIEAIAGYLLGSAFLERFARARSPASSGSIRLLERIGGWVGRPEVAASFGIVFLFFVINSSHRLLGLPWIPRVLTGLTILVVLAWPAIVARRRGLRRASETTSAAADSPLVLRDVTVSYGERNVLEDVTLEASPGEVLLIEGDNGSGKSTLMAAIVGRVEATGSFSIPGAGGPASPPQRSVAYLPQHADRVSSAEVSVAEHVVVARTERLSVLRPWRSAWCRAEGINLPNGVVNAEAAVGSLSGGQRQALLVSIVAERPSSQVFVFDEPYSALDREMRESVKATIERLAESGKVVLVADHNGQHTACRAVRAPFRSAAAFRSQREVG